MAPMAAGSMRRSSAVEAGSASSTHPESASNGLMSTPAPAAAAASSRGTGEAVQALARSVRAASHWTTVLDAAASR